MYLRVDFYNNLVFDLGDTRHFCMRCKLHCIPHKPKKQLTFSGFSFSVD